ncbi:MAG: rhodanese-related sulfurtransferase [Rhodobacteraceae bacterium]|nr:rhodanese-related sulfurtransferase [Paracoccaceae bacterium]
MFTVAALYKFTPFADPAALRGPLLAVSDGEGVRGTLLLAREGINGTIAGNRAGIEAVLAHIRALPGCGDLDWKESTAAEMPFGRMKVRLKREIVTMGEPDVDPLAGTGRYVEPTEWNDLISAPDVVVIDTRNEYEVAIGTFDGAIDPGTKSFREFPAWWRENAQRFGNKRVAMFCTGGIRCEKSTNFLLNEGVSEVFHLKGGILKYLEEVPEEASLWHGKCFVFDQRVSVGHGLVEGEHSLCHGCRRPLTPEDMMRPEYEAGVSCHQCHDSSSTNQRERFRERQRQMVRATERGSRHLGR